MKKIAIIGARKRNSPYDLRCCKHVFMSIYEEGDMIVSGGCPQGGDRFAEIIAKELNIQIEVIKPDWGKYGKRAGFQRNAIIADVSDCVIAVVTEDKENCKGTMDTVNRMSLMNKDVYLVKDILDFDPEIDI